jgi:4-hydroxy-3-polyprenylbenzoate decarboxylase
MKLLVAVGGASGSLYARRLLECLAGAASALEVGLCFSPRGLEVWRHELGSEPSFAFRRFAIDDFAAPFASGSARWDAVVAIPCSMGRLARIAHGVGDDLISRAADVALKERRKLVLVVRETPLSQIHLENMLTVTRAGAVILPAAPSFYGRPATIEQLADTVVARVLDQLSIAHTLGIRWAAEEAPR